jgi:hypothetical protein
MSTAKMLFSITISTKNGHFVILDLNTCYQGMPLRIWEYMRIHISTIPDSIIAQYKLLGLVHNGYVLVDTMKGMYGLTQAGILTYDKLIAHLAKHGYAP